MSEKEISEGEIISEDELDERKWKHILTFADTWEFFEKGDKYLFWDSESEKVVIVKEKNK